MVKMTFDTQFLANIKTSLEQERDRLTTELSQLTGSGEVDAAAMPNYGDEEDENAREVADFTANKPLELSLEGSLRDVVNALDRLVDGSYGVCKYCGEPIDEKRLLARPTSNSCVECKKTLTQEA